MIQCRKIKLEDSNSLHRYFEDLSPETKGYFAPHPFDFDTITSICNENYKDYLAFVCTKDDQIAGYTVVKRSLSESESDRVFKYPALIDTETDYLLAPSVADAFQSQGIGSTLFHFVETELMKLGARKIVLWGGVQKRNQRAVQYYLKNGFETFGAFHSNGLNNLDMLKHLDDKAPN
ncbi:MAG: GNAT family N-acetyltransferase [Bacteroidota bacterium]